MDIITEIEKLYVILSYIFAIAILIFSIGMVLRGGGKLLTMARWDWQYLVIPFAVIAMVIIGIPLVPEKTLAAVADSIQMSRPQMARVINELQLLWDDVDTMHGQNELFATATPLPEAPVIIAPPTPTLEPTPTLDLRPTATPLPIEPTEPPAPTAETTLTPTTAATQTAPSDSEGPEATATPIDPGAWNPQTRVFVAPTPRGGR